MEYNLAERTESFASNIVKFCQRIPRNSVTLPLIYQLVKSGTSPGANYCEADNAESKLDFEHKIGICKKETKESEYWLKIIAVSCPDLKKETEPLIKEAHELNLIFNAIINSSKKNRITNT